MTRRLAVLRHDDGLDLDGPVLRRRAVRAVVLRGRTLLLLRTRDGHFAFPGGGVQPGESDEDALRREVEEECGLGVGVVLGSLGDVHELAAARPDDGCDVFAMTSVYLRCTVVPGPGRSRLSPAEAALGLEPVWTDVDEAIAVNRSGLVDGPRFLRRELVALTAVAAWAAGADG